MPPSPNGKGTPQGGGISPLLSNVYLHWFETCATRVAKQTNQVMSTVRYADDFVILAGKLKDGFVRRVEHELEHRFDLVVNREKTKVIDMDAPKAALAFLGHEFRKVRDRRDLTGKTYLEYGPSGKSVKKVCAKVKEETGRRKLFRAVDGVVERLNLVLDGWGRYFRYGYPTRQFAKVNAYVRKRLYIFLNRKSQRKYRLKYAETFYGECQKLGLTRKRYCR